jgi:hypothetical protein
MQYRRSKKQLHAFHLLHHCLAFPKLPRSTCADVFITCGYLLICAQRVCEQRGTKECAVTSSVVPQNTPTLLKRRETHRRARRHGMRLVA